MLSTARRAKTHLMMACRKYCCMSQYLITSDLLTLTKDPF